MIRSKVSKCQISCFISTLSPIFDTRDFIILLVGKWTTLITCSPIMYCPANFSKHAVSALGHLNKLSFSNITYPASFFFLPKSMQFLHWALYSISNFILISPCKFFSVWPSITALTRTNAPLLAWQWVSLLPNTTGFILIGLPHRHYLWSIFFSRNIC